MKGSHRCATAGDGAPLEISIDAPISAFDDKHQQPSDDELREALGKAYTAWTELITLVDERIGPLNELWAFGTGWGLRLRHKERVILYMTPQRNSFLVSLALGERAVAATQHARFPAALVDAIASAPRYTEGRGVRVTVTSTRQVPGLVKLAEVKRQN